MVKEKRVDSFFKRESDVCERQETGAACELGAVPVSDSEPVAYGFFCFGVACGYIDWECIL
jgi:hypothetical protein